MAVEIVDLHIIKMVIFHNSYVCLPEGTCGICGFSDGLCASSWKNILSTDQIVQQFLSDLTRFDEVWWSLMNSYVGKIPWTQMGVVCVLNRRVSCMQRFFRWLKIFGCSPSPRDDLPDRLSDGMNGTWLHQGCMSLLLEWGRTMEVSRAYSNLLKRECNLSSQFFVWKGQENLQNPIFSVSHEVGDPHHSRTNPRKKLAVLSFGL